MFYQIFLSPQVNWCAIITYKHGIYELPHELPSDLRPKKNTDKIFPVVRHFTLELVSDILWLIAVYIFLI